MSVEQKVFGKIDGTEIKQYLLKNDKGMIVKVMEYGATITSIALPSTTEHIDVVCGFDKFEDYLSAEYISNNPYFGCVVGRYANRIKDGKFTLGQKTYELTLNNGNNHLHGGIKGFDKKIWNSKAFKSSNSIGVEFSMTSPHLEEGYPGNVQVKVVYELNNNNELYINYYAETDKKTPLALTNHTYFNLSGFKENVGSHEVMIKSDRLLIKDESNCPDGNVEPVKESFDFRVKKSLLDTLKKLPSGIDHYYVLNKKQKLTEKAADFEYAKNGITLEVYTTEPGMQFYTGQYISNSLSRNKANQYGPLSAFCCETQRYPNGVNIADSPGSYTLVDEPFESTTIYKFKFDESKL